MILKGSQRGGGLQLANHLLNEIDNDHVTLQELRGFVADDLHGALAEAYAVSKGTKCQQFMFSLSLNPPKGAECRLEDMIDAADRAEEGLGLKDQPRAIVVHEKEGRRHIHVVWSRIDTDTMKAVELPFFKNRLAGLSKALYLEHGWELPEGHRENGWRSPLNFTLAEWQQCRRIGMDPREVKQLFADAWKHSDGLKSFKAALEDRGFFLARGDRRGFVAVDLGGEVFSVARLVGVKVKETEARLGSPAALDGVEAVTARIKERTTQRMKDHAKDVGDIHRQELRPLVDNLRTAVGRQRAERLRLRNAQEKRRKIETASRQSRFRRGVRGLWDVLTGRAGTIRRDNEREAFDLFRREIMERERLFELQMQERLEVQRKIEAIRLDHRSSLKRLRQHSAALIVGPLEQHRSRGLELRL